jgi:hypothetical protein
MEEFDETFGQFEDEELQEEKELRIEPTVAKDTRKSDKHPDPNKLIYSQVLGVYY